MGATPALAVGTDGFSERRMLLSAALLAGAALALATPAGAAMLPYTGTLSIQVGPVSILSISGAVSGTVTVNGSGAPGHLTALDVAAGALDTGLVEVPITDLSALPIVGMQLDADNQAGALAGSGGAGFGGAMPLLGFVKLCTFPSPCASAVNNIVVPLSAVGTSATGTFEQAGIAVTVVGAPWTTGTVSVGTATAMGGIAPASATGAVSGSVTLVTPIFISTNIGAFAAIPSLGTLTLHFVPEPATLALLGAGVLALGTAGRRRRAAR